MSSSPALEASSPSTTPSSPALKPEIQFHTSTPNIVTRKQYQPLNVVLPGTAPATPPNQNSNEATTPPPRSPGAGVTTPASGDARSHPPDGTSSDKSSETAVVNTSRPQSACTALSRKESYKAQRQHYSREKKRAATALLHSIEDPSVVVLNDWLKVRGSLKSWTKLWCVLKPGLLLLYKTPKAKSSHWVGTVLLTSCQVIERPSKKDGFCFKIYHPLEQSIWAPRGPHNESIGAVVQPLPTAHLIFRAPSQAAGHCWLDGLELALTCSNAMLRCSRSRPAQTVAAEAPITQTTISHEELEKHFNEHAVKTPLHSPPIMSVTDYSSKTLKKHKPTKWDKFVESIDKISRDHTSSDSGDDKKEGFLDFFWKKDWLDRYASSNSSMRVVREKQKPISKSLASSPRLDIAKTHLTRCFDMKPLDRKKSLTVEDNIVNLMSLSNRRCSTPSTKYLTQKRISQLRESGSKTDSENDDVFLKELPKKRRVDSKVICSTPDNIIITETAPSLERFRRYSSSSDDVFDLEYRKSPTYPSLHPQVDKYSLIDYSMLPSAAYAAERTTRRAERLADNVYVAGKIVRDCYESELAGAASDTDSEGSRVMVARASDVLARIQAKYVEDPDRDVGAAGELVEEVGEENKSLLWFLLKQVRPGMDLSKVVLPTFILEPRSFLDKLADSYYHADILTQAQTMEDPYKRFKLVLRWFLSGLYRKPKGLKKPYNPVLGETFRCCWKHAEPSTYTYYVAEQVSHHPPVSAFYVSNRKDGYVIEGSLLARSKFYGNSTSAILEGSVRVHLLSWNETYVTTAPYAHCKGIVIGTLSMELGGKVQVVCESTDYHADIEFKLRSFLSSADQTNAISGRIKKGKDTIGTIDGFWDGRIDIKDKKSGEEINLLDVALLKEQRLPRYLVKLDEQTEFESQRLWLKVSEAIANDDQVAATEQKTVIEEAQRVRARNITSWTPRFFHREPEFEGPDGIVDQGWRYNHINTTPWLPEESLEYEEEFIIQSVGGGTKALRPSLTTERATSSPRLLARPSDSESHDELPRAKISTRTLKNTLLAIESSLREQTLAIERLSKQVETLNSGAMGNRPLNLGRMPYSTHSWDLFGGFVLAIVLQALLNWLFYHKD